MSRIVEMGNGELALELNVRDAEILLNLIDEDDLPVDEEMAAFLDELRALVKANHG